MKKMTARSFAGALLLALGMNCALFSTGIAAEKAQTQKVPTSIKADSMNYDANGQTVVFNGSVYVKRPDFELWSKKLTVYLDKSTVRSSNGTDDAFGAGGMQAGSVDRIVAEQDVRMKSKDKEGSCQKATYYAADDKIVMEGKPVLRDQKKNFIAGALITHFLQANRSEVRTPQATFYAPDKKGGDTALPDDGKAGKGKR